MKSFLGLASLVNFDYGYLSKKHKRIILRSWLSPDLNNEEIRFIINAMSAADSHWIFDPIDKALEKNIIKKLTKKNEETKEKS